VCYDLRCNTFKELPKFAPERYTHSSLYLDGYLYVLGGRHYGSDEEAILNNVIRLRVDD
jgi:hypothetical protein